MVVTEPAPGCRFVNVDGTTCTVTRVETWTDEETDESARVAMYRADGGSSEPGKRVDLFAEVVEWWLT